MRSRLDEAHKEYNFKDSRQNVSLHKHSWFPTQFGPSRLDDKTFSRTPEDGGDLAGYSSPGLKKKKPEMIVRFERGRCKLRDPSGKSLEIVCIQEDFSTVAVPHPRMLEDQFREKDRYNDVLIITGTPAP